MTLRLAALLIAQALAAGEVEPGSIRIGREAGGLRVRKAGSLRYIPVKQRTTVRPGSTLCLDATLFSSEPRARILDDTGKAVHLAGEQCLVLTNAVFADPPAQIGARDQKDVGLPLNALDAPPTGGRKILRFLTGSNADVGSLAVPAEALARKAKLTPIIPLYPPVVKVIETTALPVTVTLEWPVFSGQAEPHKVYLWSDRLSVYTPWQTVAGGKTVATLGHYGKYYWHVEDADARHASAPRTIIVRAPRTPLVTVKAGNEDVAVTRIAVREPGPNTILAGCIDGSSVPASVVFENPAETATFFRVVTVPDGVMVSAEVTPPDDPGGSHRLGFARLKLIAPADGELRVLAYHDKDATTPVAASEPIAFRTVRACGKAGIDAALKEALAGETLPAGGGITLGGEP